LPNKAAKVYAVEIIAALAARAAADLKPLGYAHVFARFGDGYKDWLEAAPLNFGTCCSIIH